MDKYLAADYFFEIHLPEVQDMVKEARALPSSEAQIEALYLFVRDHWRYSPYRIGLTKGHYKVSTIIQQSEAHCIDKAIILITLLRAVHVPARLRLAKVSNHIATEAIEQKLGTNELAPHGLVDVYNNGKWVKCSPTFNAELCERYNVEPLTFNGTKDSIFQEYNKDNQKFMSYIEDYGHFETVPHEFMVDIFKSHYPSIFERYQGISEVDLSKNNF